MRWCTEKVKLRKVMVKGISKCFALFRTGYMEVTISFPSITTSTFHHTISPNTSGTLKTTALDTPSNDPLSNKQIHNDTLLAAIFACQ